MPDITTDLLDTAVKPSVLPRKPAPQDDPYAGLGIEEPLPRAPVATVPAEDPYANLGIETPITADKPLPVEDPYAGLGIEPTPAPTAPAPPAGFRKILGYAPEQALSLAAHVVDFPLALVRGTRETSRLPWVAIIGEEKTAAIEQLSYRIPVFGKWLKEGDKLLDAVGNFKNEADALLMQEALKQGGLPGVAVAALTNTVIDTLMTLKTLKVLGIGYGTQPGIKSTLGSAAIRATVMAIFAEGLTPKDRFAALALGFAYQATPALSGTIGKWFKSDWIAKVVDVTANATITATFGKVVDEGFARAEAEGTPEKAGFYVMLNAIQKYGADVVFGLMTKSFKASRNPAVAREIEKVAKAANVKVLTAAEVDVAPKPAEVVLPARTAEEAARIPPEPTITEAKPAIPSAPVVPVAAQKAEIVPEAGVKPIEAPAPVKAATEVTSVGQLNPGDSFQYRQGGPVYRAMAAVDKQGRRVRIIDANGREDEIVHDTPVIPFAAPPAARMEAPVPAKPVQPPANIVDRATTSDELLSGVIMYHSPTKGAIKGIPSVDIGGDADIMGKGLYLGSENYARRYGEPAPIIVKGNFASTQEWTDALEKHKSQPIKEQRKLARESLKKQGYDGVVQGEVVLVWNQKAIQPPTPTPVF